MPGRAVLEQHACDGARVHPEPGVRPRVGGSGDKSYGTVFSRETQDTKVLSKFERGVESFNYGFGYMDKIKPQDSDRFISMSEAAGSDVKRGVFVGGGRVSCRDFTFGAIDYYSNDIINIFYSEGTYKLAVTDHLGFLFSAQFTDQRSVGQDLLKGFSFSTNQVGVKSDISYGSAILTLGYTHTSKGADMQNPWGGYPGYTGVQVQDFNRAGENAFMAELSYNFGRFGFEGITKYALFVHAWGRVDPSTKASFQTRTSLTSMSSDNLNGDFSKVSGSGYDMPWFISTKRPKNTLNDFRVIVNYDFPLL